MGGIKLLNIPCANTLNIPSVIKEQAQSDYSVVFHYSGTSKNVSQ